MGSRSRRRITRSGRERVDEVLLQFDLQDVRERLAGSLTIGSARLLELGRAIVNPPTLLLLDETSSGLATEEAERVSEAIRVTRERTGCTVLLVEHDVGFVTKLCERITVLDNGEVLASGTPAEVTENVLVRSAYLGPEFRPKESSFLRDNQKSFVWS